MAIDADANFSPGHTTSPLLAATELGHTQIVNALQMAQADLFLKPEIKQAILKLLKTAAVKE